MVNTEIAPGNSWQQLTTRVFSHKVKTTVMHRTDFETGKDSKLTEVHQHLHSPESNVRYSRREAAKVKTHQKDF